MTPKLPVMVLSLFLLASSAARPSDSPAAAAARPSLQLVETYPVETTLDDPAMPEAFQVWNEMVGGAEKTLDFAEFYASDEPGSRLEPIVAAIEAAADRGVRVRFLAEKKFYATYPETIDRLRSRAGVQVRLYDVAALMGGVCFMQSTSSSTAGRSIWEARTSTGVR